jgi:hypothetical protein
LRERCQGQEEEISEEECIQVSLPKEDLKSFLFFGTRGKSARSFEDEDFQVAKVFGSYQKRNAFKNEYPDCDIIIQSRKQLYQQVGLN